MADAFISLAALALGSARAAPAPAPAPAVAEPAHALVPETALAYPHAALVQELGAMRLAALEAFERCIPRLLRALAEDVLLRELTHGAADVEALVRRIVAGYAEAEPVEVVVSAADAERVRTPLPLRVGPALAAGDAIVRVRDGDLESYMTFRLTEAVARAQGDGA